MIPLLVLQSSSFAMCSKQPEYTSISDRTLAPTSSIDATSSWGSAAQLATRLRLRGPDGVLVPVRREVLGLEARLVPVEPLKPGHYTVEERGDYDQHGARSFGRPHSSSAWFTAQKVEVMPQTVASSPAPDVTWHRDPRGIYAPTVRTEQMSWVDLEVRGVGTIARRGISTEDVFHLNTGAAVRCNDTGQWIPLPSSGDLTVRVVAHGDAGWRAESPWTTIGVGARGETWNPGPAGQPTGTAASTAGLSTWSELSVSADERPLVVTGASCRSLERVSREETTRDGTAMRDDAGRLRIVTSGRAGNQVDGMPTRGLIHPIRDIAGRGDTLFLLEGALLPRVVRIEGGRVTHSTSLASEGLIDIQADGDGVVVHTRESEGQRWTQRLDATLAPLDEPSEVLLPPTILHRSNQTFLNGRPIELGRGPFWVWEDRVALVHHDDQGNHVEVVVYDPLGKIVHTMALPHGRVRLVAMDEMGIGVEASDRENKSTSFFGETWKGEPRTLYDVPRPPFPQTEVERVPFGDRTILVQRERFAVADAAQRQSAPVPSFGTSVVGVDEDEIVVVRTRRSGRSHTQVWTETRYRCTPEAIGVPDHWLPE